MLQIKYLYFSQALTIYNTNYLIILLLLFELTNTLQKFSMSRPENIYHENAKQYHEY